MIPYILLILYILLLAIAAEYLFQEKERKERFILDMGILALFLLLALKKNTVGIDIAGYRQQYLLSANMPWADTDYVYFEAGFIQLMKLFSKANVPFGVFTALIYGVCCSAYREFIRRYSANAALSLLIFVCYQFLVFSMSGLRQALAMAMCLWAWMTLEKGKDGKHGLLALALVVVSSTVHRSALMALPTLLFLYKPGKVYWPVFLALLAVSPGLRPGVHNFLAFLLDQDISGGQVILGGNFVFLLAMAVFCVIGYYNCSDEKEDTYCVGVNILMLSVVAQVLFSGSAMLRGAMYLTVFLIPTLPRALKRFDQGIESLGTWLLGLFLVWLFWHDTLAINQLHICPYQFFWQ